LGIVSLLWTGINRARRFDSSLLISLAKEMGFESGGGAFDRYYMCKSLAAGALSFEDRVLFDQRFVESLSDEEFRAVGAHEFVHIRSNHSKKKLRRILLPIVATTALICVVASVYIFEAIDSLGISFASKIEFTALLSVIPTGLVFFLSSIVVAYLNAKWLRSLETECDNTAVKYADGEALISALHKLQKIYPPRESGLAYRLRPKSYPKLEARILHIKSISTQEAK
jgi:Zn-dependent protease with chaperone function